MVRRILPALLLPLLLAACSNQSEAPKTLSDYKDATTVDSLMFYFGQIRAAEYWREAATDTTLQTRENRDEFLKGIRAGISAVRDNDAYNQGYYVGLQLAMNLQQFEKDYGVKSNRTILLEAMTDGLKNDSAVNIGEANAGFQNVIAGLNAQKEARDQENAQAALEKDAKALKMTEINKDLYASAPSGHIEGKQLQIGDSTAVVIDIELMNGEVIDNRAHHNFVVGASMPGPITEALLTMHQEENRIFITTAPALMGRFYERRGLEATDVLKLNITTRKVGAIPDPKAQAHKEPTSDNTSK